MIVQNVVGGSYVSQSPIALGEETINFIPELIEQPGGKNRMVLYPSPGVTRFSESSTLEGCRGTASFAGRMFAVYGASFVEFDQNGLETIQGTVTFTENTPVTISYNGDGGGQLLITSCGDAYIFILATDHFGAAGFTGYASQGGMLDGFFLILDAQTSTLYISDLLDGLTWDPLQFAQRSIASDAWVAMLVTYREIYLIGSATSEIWTFTGAYPFPFAPIPNTLLTYGTAAAFSPTLVDGNPCWLTSRANGFGQVILVEGVSPRVISTMALDFILGGFGTLSDAIGQSIEINGHKLYVLTFPTEQDTRVFDTTTNLWVRFLEWVDGDWAAWRPLYMTHAFGLLLAGDWTNEFLFALSVENASSATGLVTGDLNTRRLRRAALPFDENQLLYVEYIELFLESGLGLVSGLGSDPVGMMRLSRNGGKTWSNELWRSAGELGQYGKRMRWNRLGRGRDFVAEWVFSDPIPWRIVNSFASIERAA